MAREPLRVLLVGFGNPGRLDDGLGPALAAEIEKLALTGVTVDADYQLSVEDAAAVAEHDVVVFADAAETGPAPCFFERIQPRTALSFSSHSVRPEAVLGLAEDLFERRVPGYLLGIRGYEFNEYGQRLSPRAEQNLRAAVTLLTAVLREGTFEETATRYERGSSGEARASDGDMICKTENT